MGWALRGSDGQVQGNRVVHCSAPTSLHSQGVCNSGLHWKGPQLPFLKRQHALNGINSGVFACEGKVALAPKLEASWDFC